VLGLRPGGVEAGGDGGLGLLDLHQRLGSQGGILQLVEDAIDVDDHDVVISHW
jgi:hypothetical protein